MKPGFIMSDCLIFNINKINITINFININVLY
jgi:hypothetical protein